MYDNEFKTPGFVKLVGVVIFLAVMGMVLYLMGVALP
jgi:hypothetical protein